MAFCQSQDPAEISVGTLLKELSNGYYEGFAVGPVNWLGDAASVALTKILADHKPSPKNIENMLVVLREAFGRPSIVVIESDRQPRTALFILQYFDSITMSVGLKKKITDAKRFVVEQAKIASLPASR
jgi:hypothetical protein